MVKFRHAIFCRKCRLFMEIGAFDWQQGYFEGPFIHETTERTGSDWALRRFLEEHRRHNMGFASDNEIDELLRAGFKEIQPSDRWCMSFISDPRRTDYNFENFSKRFQKVLFIIDVYGWAWDVANRGLLKFLPEVDGTIIDSNDFRKMDFKPEDWDMVLVYPWSNEKLMERLDPRNTVVIAGGNEQLRVMRQTFNINCGRFIVYGANSRPIQKFLEKNYPNKRVVLLGRGVDTEKFKPNPVPHDEFTVGWVGATNRKIKRFWVAQKICEEVGVKLKVAGRGDEATYIPHDEMPDFYNSIDVLLITSDSEAHPLIFYEAMSCGVPVVTGNVGDIYETIENGVNGFMFDSCSQGKGFRSALELLRDDPELRKSMGENARRSILHKWKWESVVNQWRVLGKIDPPKDESPKVTVVTAVKDRERTIRRCVDSVLAENYPNLEYIIVDGASTDGTLNILREYEEKHDFIQVISEPDRSQGEARNKGLDIATGDYVTFLDSDDAMIDGKLGTLSEFLANSEKHFAVFGNTAFCKPGSETIFTDNGRDIPDEISFETLNQHNYIGSGGIMLRNSPEVRFDPDVRFGEDHLLWMDIVAKYPIAHLDFNAYKWTQGSPDGIGKTTEDWKERSQANKANALASYSGGHHSMKMRIAVFCDTFGVHPWGGPAIYGYNVVEMLYRGRNPFMMFYNSDSTAYPHPAYYRREEHLQPRTRDFDPSDFDVFYTMNSGNAARMLNEKGISPIIGSNHITNSAPEHCLQFLDEKMLIRRGHLIQHEKAFLRNYSGRFWLAQSKFQIGEYQRVGMNLDEIRVYLASNPTDTDLFRRRQNYGDYIVWSGKNNWAKGVPFLEKVVNTFPDEKFKILWGGEGADFPLLTQNAELVTGSTLFQIPGHLETGKVFASTSVTENQPCAALEAMAMELPVVGFHTSGMPEIVENGETGFLVELGNTDAYSEKLDLLLNDESLRREMGRKARKYVEKNFSYYSTLDRYLGLFKLYLEE